MPVGAGTPFHFPRPPNEARSSGLRKFSSDCIETPLLKGAFQTFEDARRESSHHGLDGEGLLTGR